MKRKYTCLNYQLEVLVCDSACSATLSASYSGNVKDQGVRPVVHFLKPHTKLSHNHHLYTVTKSINLSAEHALSRKG